MEKVNRVVFVSLPLSVILFFSHFLVNKTFGEFGEIGGANY